MVRLGERGLTVRSFVLLHLLSLSREVGLLLAWTLGPEKEGPQSEWSRGTRPIVQAPACSLLADVLLAEASPVTSFLNLWQELATYKTPEQCFHSQFVSLALLSLQCYACLIPRFPLLCLPL